MGETQTHRSVADAELCGNLPQACSLGPQPSHLSVIHNPARTPKLLAASPRIANPSTHALADKVALQLGNSRHNREECLSERAAGINVLLIAYELNAEGTELL